MLTNEQHIPNFITIIISMMSGVIMIGVYAINHRLAKQTKSSSLDSASKDNLSDGFSQYWYCYWIIIYTIWSTYH